MTEALSPDRIVVGVDGSRPSLSALRRGAQIAAALDLTVEAITTWDYPPMIDAYYTADWTLDEDAAKLLATAVDDAFDGSPPEGLRQTVLQGPAARLLIEHSRGAYMLVLGSRGHGGFVGLLVGSVSSACAAHAHCPVLIMHED
ncbi:MULTISPECIES: universal stress protein [unclassified Dietzia]|uniref:universal stress protein n=1 Tax=unclassified Dietzia TaxID=2617939 RepID=UPI000D2266B7|nr:MULTISPECIES: universal stress protein [unclassified Dietzia]AVZ39885.1 universal stress protein UspA [Dietzia sp. JS16-p6b]QGW25278.1 UspA domain-containing protein [Dietzia sp. DQ12-45-1b]